MGGQRAIKKTTLFQLPALAQSWFSTTLSFLFNCKLMIDFMVLIKGIWLFCDPIILTVLKLKYLRVMPQIFMQCCSLAIRESNNKEIRFRYFCIGFVLVISRCYTIELLTGSDSSCSTYRFNLLIYGLCNKIELQINLLFYAVIIKAIFIVIQNIEITPINDCFCTP